MCFRIYCKKMTKLKFQEVVIFPVAYVEIKSKSPFIIQRLAIRTHLTDMICIEVTISATSVYTTIVYNYKT